MTAELLNTFPMNSELLQEFRSSTLAELKKTPELYYEYDMKKLEEDDLYAHKFLAHQFFLNEDKKTLLKRATKMVLKSFKWRKEFGVQNIKKEDFPDEYFDRKGCIMLKKDKEGREVVIILVNKLRKTKPGEKEMGEKFLVYWLENVYQRNIYGITIIIDCSDAVVDNVNMDMVTFAKKLFKRHYPGFLGYFLVYKMPKLLENVWDVIKKLLPKAGIDRIKFVDKKSILEYIEADKLPEYLGGTDKSEFEYHESLKDTALLFLAQGVKNVSLK